MKNQVSSGIRLSTAYFPPILYMAIIAGNDNIIIETGETYQKQTYRNRCVIMTANGKLNLTVPVIKTNGNHTLTHDIIIDSKWQKNHWKAISSAYSSSPFFLYYKDEIINFFKENRTSLIGLNTDIISTLCQTIGIKRSYVISNEFTKPNNNSNDYRFSISPKSKLKIGVYEKYFQVFSNKFPFAENLSILDLLFNLGPETKNYLLEVNKSLQL